MPWARFRQPSPLRERPHVHVLVGGHDAVSTHAPLAGSDALTGPQLERRGQFNPRPCGSDESRSPSLCRPACFDSTLPLRERQLYELLRRCCRQFNPRLLAGERHACRRDGRRGHVSTHALRGATAPCPIRDGRRPVSPTPLRGATLVIVHFPPRSRFQPTPQGERPRPTSLARTLTVFNRSLGSDLKGVRIHVPVQRFQPTLPLRGATERRNGAAKRSQFQPTLLAGSDLFRCANAVNANVSTHAPCGSDADRGGRRAGVQGFNPRPCGERRSYFRSTSRG